MPSRATLILALILLSGTTLAPRPSVAGESFTPIQLSLFSPVQIFPEDWSVTGLRISALLGVNRNLRGLDVAAAVTRTEGNVEGVQFALANQVEGDCTGLQVGVSNEVDGLLRGLQISGLGSNAGHGSGAQISVWNSADEMQGLQIGVLNFGGEMKGLQLGVLNFNDNGFLPFFPIFNFGY